MRDTAVFKTVIWRTGQKLGTVNRREENLEQRRVEGVEGFTFIAKL